jgi:thiamine-phosphate pyrophosphorylase
MNPPRPRSRPKLRGLYLITPDDADTARLLARVTAVLPHAALLQYRNKSANDSLRRSQLLALLPACRAAGVPLIVNDDWQLAIELEAEGAHLGSEDGDLRRARDGAGDDFILGASCYDDPRRAEAAAAAGADYLAFGAFHPSPTKPDARRADTQLLRDGRRHGLPVVAIGGITLDNAAALIAAGADMIAVISGVFDAVDPVVAADAYARHFDTTQLHFPEDA